jgi:hypothetical protein
MRLVPGSSAGQDQLQFRNVTKAGYARSAFHDDRIESADRSGCRLLVDPILEQLPKPSAPMHFVFHTAFCGSTILSRALELTRPSLGLREPALLNQLSHWWGHDTPARDWSQVLKLAVSLMSRRWPGQQGVIVKPNDPSNELIAELLRATPDAHGVLLHASLADFVAQCLKAGGGREAWVDARAASLIPWIRKKQEAFPLYKADSSSAEKAAFIWGRYLKLFSAARRQLGSRLQVLSFDQVLRAPVETAALAHAHLWGSPPSREALEAVRSSDVLATHSKVTDAFSASKFQRERAENRDRFRSEIAEATRWVERNLKIDPAGLALSR